MAWVALGVAAVNAYGQSESAKNKSGSAMPGMGMAADARGTDAIFDNSGWNVSFGSSKIESAAEKTMSQSGPSPTNSPALGSTIGTAGSALAGIDQNIIYAAIFVALLLAWKRKSS
jgi:hypothetical protein